MSVPPASRPVDLVGSWRKAGSPSCAQKYPDEVTFSAGTFRANRGVGQGFVWWDAGIYRLESADRLVMGTANDELVTYAIHLDGDLLSVTDPDGCEWSYTRRAQPPG